MTLARLSGLSSGGNRRRRNGPGSRKPSPKHGRQGRRMPWSSIVSARVRRAAGLRLARTLHGLKQGGWWSLGQRRGSNLDARVSRRSSKMCGTPGGICGRRICRLGTLAGRGTKRSWPGRDVRHRRSGPPMEGRVHERTPAGANDGGTRRASVVAEAVWRSLGCRSTPAEIQRCIVRLVGGMGKQHAGGQAAEATGTVAAAGPPGRIAGGPCLPQGR